MSDTNLVMGAAIGYSEQQITPFVSSLRMSGYQGAIFLLVSAEVAKSIKGNPVFKGVHVEQVSQWFPVRSKIVRSQLLMQTIWAPQRLLLWAMMRIGARSNKASCLGKLARWAACRLHPPSETRYIHYLDFLRSQAHFSRILISDVRDVVFQRDPFELLPEEGLAVSMEVPAYTLATEPYNAGWIRNLYGEEALARVGDKPVSCSGVSYGERTAMEAYLEKMTQEIMSMTYGAIRKTMGGYDQGIHNVLLHTGQLVDAIRLTSLSSAVATVNGLEKDTLRFDARGMLINRDESDIAIVHQYDRVPELRDHYQTLANAHSKQCTDSH